MCGGAGAARRAVAQRNSSRTSWRRFIALNYLGVFKPVVQIALYQLRLTFRQRGVSTL